MIIANKQNFKELKIPLWHSAQIYMCIHNQAFSFHQRNFHQAKKYERKKGLEDKWVRESGMETLCEGESDTERHRETQRGCEAQ
jgi:agmatine/peptidylarginine deiminase